MCVYYITLTFLAVILNFIVMVKEWIVLIWGKLTPSIQQARIHFPFI